MTPSVLLVDDDDAFVKHVGVELEREGCRVKTAGGAFAAFDLWTEDRQDLIITDVRMPNGTGVDLLTRLADSGTDVPIVFVVTGFSDTILADAFDKGASAVFRKPVSVGDLLAAARHFLRILEQRRYYEQELVRLRASLMPIDQTQTAACEPFELGNALLNGIGERDVQLTLIELKIVTLLTQAPAQTLDRPTIVRRIWGSGSYGTNTFNVHLHRLRKKLRASGYDVKRVGEDTYCLQVELTTT